VNHDEAVGGRERQRPQQNAIHNAEDRRVGPDAERERKHSHSGEAWVLQKHPAGVAEVLKENSHNAVQARWRIGGTRGQKRCEPHRPAEMRAVRAAKHFETRIGQRNCIDTGLL
jgi:hypothetical protein